MSMISFFFFFFFFFFLENFSPTNLTAYVVDAHTLSVTWDLPSNVNKINKVYLTITELSQTNRTIQMQSLDNTIKKLEIEINDNDPYSIHRNTTVHFAALCSNRHGQNSSITDYQLYINMLSKFSFSFFLFFFFFFFFFNKPIDKLTFYL